MAQIAFPIHRSNLPFCLRKIFAASSWKQLHGAGGGFEFKRSRWDLHALLNVALLMALDDAPTLGERFEKARETYSALYPKRRQCGQTVSGLLSAQKEIPDAVHAKLRSVLQQRMGTEAARCGRWHAFGVDGTHQNAPRTRSNEQHLGTVAKEPAVPQLTIVAAVALAQRVVWDWAVGKAADSERALALQVIERLPENALVVGDAGMSSYAWTQTVLNAGCHVLLRVGANVALWTEQVAGAKLKSGEVWLWPQAKRGQAPLRLRLICLRIRRRKPVYLLTDILDERALSAQQARELYDCAGRPAKAHSEIGNARLKRTRCAAERQNKRGRNVSSACMR